MIENSHKAIYRQAMQKATVKQKRRKNTALNKILEMKITEIKQRI
jgi:hypothetical protein